MAAAQVVIRILGENSSAVRSLKQVNQQLEGNRKAFDRDFGEIARIAQRGALVVGAAAAAMGVTVGAIVAKSSEAFDALDQSQRQLSATAKLAGADLGVLQTTSADIAETFQLSARQANIFTAEVGRLTAKAGDISRTGDAIRDFLNLGASRGFTAEQTLEAVRQSILGIDEGTDKLFGVNPSVLYKRYADAVGRSASSLGDHEKALALLAAAQQDANRVGDQYLSFLDSAAGKQAILNARLEDAGAALGEALAPARAAVLEALADNIDVLADAIERNKGSIETGAEFLVKLGAAFVDAAGKAIEAVPKINRALLMLDPTGTGQRFLAMSAAVGIRNPLLADELANDVGPLGAAGGASTPATGAGTGTGTGTKASEAAEAARKALDERIKGLKAELRVAEILHKTSLRTIEALTTADLGLAAAPGRFFPRAAGPSNDVLFNPHEATGRIASFFATGEIPTMPGLPSLDNLMSRPFAGADDAADRWRDLQAAAKKASTEATKDGERMAAGVVSSIGVMAQAAIEDTDQMARVVIQGFGDILRSVTDNPVLGGVIGAVTGIVGSLLNRRDPMPVRVEDYGSRARQEHRETRTGPDRVHLTVITPEGRTLQETEYELRRRTSRDAIVRIPAGVRLSNG